MSLRMLYCFVIFLFMCLLVGCALSFPDGYVSKSNLLPKLTYHSATTQDPFVGNMSIGHYTACVSEGTTVLSCVGGCVSLYVDTITFECLDGG